MSNYFAAVNRNKRSITLNLKHARSKEIFLRLVEDADVVYVDTLLFLWSSMLSLNVDSVENLRPGALNRLGLGYDTLSQTNPRIILASTSGMVTHLVQGELRLTLVQDMGPLDQWLNVRDTI